MKYKFKAGDRVKLRSIESRLGHDLKVRDVVTIYRHYDEGANWIKGPAYLIHEDQKCHWWPESFFDPVTREKTGFGKFIQSIEGKEA